MPTNPGASIRGCVSPVANEGAARSPASSALEKLLPRLADLGITRLGDITGLDRVRIPVAQATRPLGLANSVSQGKGLDLAAAAVSAIMEAAEQYFAERVTQFRTTTATARALGVPEELFDLHLLPDAPADWRTVETAWVEARDLIAGQAGWLPFELVHTAYVEPAIPTDGLFIASTTGLACAFSEPQAMLHALLECVERDAIAKAQRTHGFFQRFRIDPAAIDDRDLHALVQMAHAAGLLAAFWAAPAIGKIPVVWCQVMEDGSQPLITPYPADGFAADLDPASAARRALLEAAQSRLAAISGAREDITRASFPRYTDWGAIESHRQFLNDGPRPIRLDDLHDEAADARGEPLDQALDRLARDDVTAVLSVRLDTEPCTEIVAVRVIVPELSPLDER